MLDAETALQKSLDQLVPTKNSLRILDIVEFNRVMHCVRRECGDLSLVEGPISLDLIKRLRKNHRPSKGLVTPAMNVFHDFQALSLRELEECPPNGVVDASVMCTRICMNNTLALVLEETRGAKHNDYVTVWGTVRDRREDIVRDAVALHKPGDDVLVALRRSLEKHLLSAFQQSRRRITDHTRANRRRSVIADRIERRAGSGGRTKSKETTERG